MWAEPTVTRAEPTAPWAETTAAWLGTAAVTDLLAVLVAAEEQFVSDTVGVFIN